MRTYCAAGTGSRTAVPVFSELIAKRLTKLISRPFLSLRQRKAASGMSIRCDSNEHPALLSTGIGPGAIGAPPAPSNAWCGREVQSKMTQLKVFGYCNDTGHGTVAAREISRSALLQGRRVQCGEIGLCFVDALGGRLLEPQARF